MYFTYPNPKAILVTTGDLLSQTLLENRGFSENRKPFDFSRTARSAALGFCVIAPNLHMWYTIGLPKLLSRPVFAAMSPLRKNLTGAAIDQSTFAFWIISNYMFWVNMFQVF
jgi:hypothetical protein